VVVEEDEEVLVVAVAVAVAVAEEVVLIEAGAAIGTNDQ
jgi:hypothetical protein